MNHPINWSVVARAVAAYERLGFRYVEVPWIVRPECVTATLPPGKIGFDTYGGTLVGSAEQSFAQMMADGQLPYGRYVAASPCFRDEEDETHQRTFFKVELICVLPQSLVQLEHGVARQATIIEMTNLALGFFRSVPGAEGASAVGTPEGYDIELNGLELGSYGYREFDGHYWVYGTGVAEPRLSMALAL